VYLAHLIAADIIVMGSSSIVDFIGSFRHTAFDYITLVKSLDCGLYQ
jgi:hypothetical protein